MLVKLFTRDGGFVTEAFVPPFNIAPEVILWGERFFVAATDRAPVPDPAEGERAYVEAFAYAIPGTVPAS